MSDPAAEYVRQQVSPGNPHKHEFEVESASSTWIGKETFVVHRPPRAEMSLVRAYQAASLGRMGVSADVMNLLDGRYITIESYLSVMLDKAPECWWSRDATGRVLDGRVNGKDTVEKIVAFKHVFEEDLDAVWAQVAPYLRSFGIQLSIDDTREPRSAP